MNYRKANIKDVSQLVELKRKQLIDEGCYSENNIDDELERYFFTSITNENLVVWIATEHEYIIGTAGVFFQYPPSFSNPTGRIANIITNVYTKKQYRKQGIATKLLELIPEDIKTTDCKFARLHASSQGKKLYEKIEFVDAESFMSKRILQFE